MSIKPKLSKSNRIKPKFSPLAENDIKQVFNTHWKPGYGSIRPSETAFIQALIVKYQPKTFLEIGMASGISAGLIANIMEKCDGEKLITIDHDNTFFGDTSKENGFLASEVHKAKNVSLEKRPFNISLDIAENNETFDMAFIDANHMHPWPLIDTLAIYHKLSGPRLAIHHDLQLFRKQDEARGIGPKYLWDQFDDNRKTAADDGDGNIFVLDLNIKQEEMIDIAMNAFCLPWTLGHGLSEAQFERIEAMIRRDFTDQLANLFTKRAKLVRSINKSAPETVTPLSKLRRIIGI